MRASNGAATSTGRKRVGEFTRAAGLSVASYGTYYRLGQGQDFSAYLTAAEALGAPSLRLWAGTRGSDAVDAATRRLWTADGIAAAEAAAARLTTCWQRAAIRS